jgi:ABC-type phosphate transport system substrate-binding protein
MRFITRKAVSRKRWLMALLGLISGCCTVRAQDVVFVANPSVQVPEIRDADIRAIFIGEKTRFADGSHAVPVILKGGPVNEVFLKKHLGESPEEFRAQWRKAVFTGQGAMPKAFESEEALIEYVAATPGSLGYVSRISRQDQVKVKSIVVIK